VMGLPSVSRPRMLVSLRFERVCGELVIPAHHRYMGSIFSQQLRI
jgi:hypothetical protein